MIERNMIIRSILIIYSIIYMNTIYIMENIERNSIIMIIIILSYYIIKDKEVEKIEGIIEIIIIIGIISILFLDNLITLFISIELISISIYTILYKRQNKENYHNILYYYIINSLSSFLLLYSFLSLYIQYGTIYNPYIMYWEIEGSSRYIMIIGLLIKLGVGPFYNWKVIIYSKIESMRLLLISIIPNLIYYYLISILTPGEYNNIVIIMIIINILISSLGIFSTIRFNTLIIYSSIYNIGIILYNLILYNNITNYNPYIYIIVYSINLIGFFLLVINTSKSNLNIPLTHLFFISIYIFSFIGFPPLGGFFIKFYIIYYSLLFYSPLYLFFSFLILLSSILIASLYLSYINYYNNISIGGREGEIEGNILDKNTSITTISLSSILLLSYYLLTPYIL